MNSSENTVEKFRVSKSSTNPLPSTYWFTKKELEIHLWRSVILSVKLEVFDRQIH